MSYWTGAPWPHRAPGPEPLYEVIVNISKREAKLSQRHTQNSFSPGFLEKRDRGPFFTCLNPGAQCLIIRPWLDREKLQKIEGLKRKKHKFLLKLIHYESVSFQAAVSWQSKAITNVTVCGSRPEERNPQDLFNKKSLFFFFQGTEFSAF